MKWLENIKNKKDRLKKIIPAYIILIIFPCVFSFLQYYSILKIDFEHEINITKSKIYKRSTDFLLKVSPVKHFYKYFRRLSNNIFPILIKNQQQNNSFEFIPEISKEIKKVSELSGENFSCAVFDKNANLLNSENLNEQESRFFSFLWKYIHGFKDIDYKVIETLSEFSSVAVIDYIEALSAKKENENIKIDYDLTGIYDKKYGLTSEERHRILNIANAAKKANIATVKKGFKVSVLEVLDNIASKIKGIKLLPEKTTKQEDKTEKTADAATETKDIPNDVLENAIEEEQTDVDKAKKYREQLRKVTEAQREANRRARMVKEGKAEYKWQNNNVEYVEKDADDNEEPNK